MASAALGSQPAAKPKAAEAVSPSVLREWRHFAEQLAAAERAAQAAEVLPDLQKADVQGSMFCSCYTQSRTAL